MTDGKKYICLDEEEYAVLKRAIERAKTEEQITTTSPAEYPSDSPAEEEFTTVKETETEDAPEEEDKEQEAQDSDQEETD